MYLKHLELIGFKSFADRTRLDFEPGMTAIVGPNGCGKSNLADAVRWVLGEQSAKALRGARMEDVIFNGTDLHKSMGMAEVSMTFADCESVLGTEYNEVTITRRVFRDGEGSYFINKTPCRLKDIQRLFMGTGIGTDAYSILEQGRIDQILSSRPEDRREVFEEASGITKFKADKKEAIRKLEHTEANLLRLADILREVRRQIISLQRQAGKARRYQALREELRALDLFVSRDRLETLDREIAELESRLASVVEQEEAARADVEQTEQEATRNRERLSAAEQAIAQAMESSLRAQTDLDRTRELIRVTEDRIRELQSLYERDRHDVEEAVRRREQHRATLEQLAAQLREAIAAREEAEKEWQTRSADLTTHEQRIVDLRRRLQALGDENVDIESRMARLQNELYALEATERTTTLRRERLAAEKEELQHVVALFAERQAEKARVLQTLREETAAHADRLEKRRADHEALRTQISRTLVVLADRQVQLAARRAQIEMLDRAQTAPDPCPAGTHHLLNSPADWGVQEGIVLGRLADSLRPDPAYRIALEAALHSELQALVVRDPAAATELVQLLEQKSGGSAQLLPLIPEPHGADSWPDGPGDWLADHVEAPAAWRPTLKRLLEGVRVVDRLPPPETSIPAQGTLVTRTGMVRRSNGLVEFWMSGTARDSPLTQAACRDAWSRDLVLLQQQCEDQQRTLAGLQQESARVEKDLAELEKALEEARHRLAQREGEQNIIAEEEAQARQRADTVAWEWQSLQDQASSGAARRNDIHAELEQCRTRQVEIRALVAARNEELRALENERAEKMDAVTNARVRFVERRQAAEHLGAQQQSLNASLQEVEALIQARTAELTSCQSRVGALLRQVEETRARLGPLDEEVARQAARLNDARRQREEAAEGVGVWDGRLRVGRANLDVLRARKGQVEVEVAEQRVRRQNLLESVATDYHVTVEQLATVPEPTWEDGARPDRETLETRIAELRAKLEAMGPVNLVAIEEYRQHEERLVFLTRQQEDLVKAKQQLLDFIRRINQTTTEMFSKTFDQVNAGFQEMFQKLIGGGSAKLVLVDEGDVLESGIEIIVRPPGKKLQSVSLLSGGERTMTAVALLFALYMVKPSPFCLLDELDASLDEANINRFIKVVQGFLEKSQFIVITHNRQTISAADILYGVTMEKQGVSKIVSVKFSPHHSATPVPSG